MYHYFYNIEFTLVDTDFSGLTATYKLDGVIVVPFMIVVDSQLQELKKLILEKKERGHPDATDVRITTLTLLHES